MRGVIPRSEESRGSCRHGDAHDEIPRSCGERGHREHAFGDRGNPCCGMLPPRQGGDRDAVAGVLDHGGTAGMRRLGVAGGRHHRGRVCRLRHQPHNGGHGVGPCRGGGCGAGRPRAPAAGLAGQETVTSHLTAVGRRAGLPRAIRSDNGAPWATVGRGGLTRREAWLRRLGGAPGHGRSSHPQTQGKGERVHGTSAVRIGPALTWPTPSAPALPSAPAPTWSAPRKRGTRPCPPAAPSPAPGPAQTSCLPCPTARTRRCAPAPPPVRSRGSGAATSSAAAGAANPSPSARPRRMGGGRSSLVIARSPSSPCPTRMRCHRCPRTSGTHVPGLHTQEA